jgi:hypothetical protein
LFQDLGITLANIFFVSNRKQSVVGDSLYAFKDTFDPGDRYLGRPASYLMMFIKNSVKEEHNGV